MRVAITGAAGLVGQNLLVRLKRRGLGDLVAIDKHVANMRVLRRLHPDVAAIEADMSAPGDWQQAVAEADAVVVAHAQIGGLDRHEFMANNITATERLLDAVGRMGRKRIVHISSSVVKSAAKNWYTESKTAQEALVLAAGLQTTVLRPTLMFGWFDRKNLGWLARFMKRTPVFPIPGDGRYMRQPLYAGDFCDVIAACLVSDRTVGVFDISGQRQIDYIDLMRLVKQAIGGRAVIAPIPYSVFHSLLAAYAVFDRHPPFTTRQLEALVTPDVFATIDWPDVFGVPATPLTNALEETFRDPTYASIALEF